MDSSTTYGYRGRNAALVMVGASVILAAALWLVVAVDLGRVLSIALAVAWFGTTCMAIGLARLNFELPPGVRMSVAQGAGSALIGAAGILGAFYIPVSWIGLYQPSDPRSQPGHILAAMIFAGSFATVFAVLGTVVVISRAVRGSRSH